MSLNIFSDVYKLLIFVFEYICYWVSCSHPGYYMQLIVVLHPGWGDPGLRSSYASLWPLPRQKGTFQHLYKCAIWVSSDMLLFFTHFLNIECWCFYYWFVRALYTFIALTLLSEFWLLFPQLPVYHLILWF